MLQYVICFKVVVSCFKIVCILRIGVGCLVSRVVVSCFKIVCILRIGVGCLVSRVLCFKMCVCREDVLVVGFQESCVSKIGRIAWVY